MPTAEGYPAQGSSAHTVALLQLAEPRLCSMGESFHYGVQLRDPRTSPNTPEDVAGAVMSKEVQGQETGRAR